MQHLEKLHDMRRYAGTLRTRGLPDDVLQRFIASQMKPAEFETHSIEITGGLYTIGLTHLGSRFRGIDLAGANAMFVMMYALGMIFGPAVGGISMQKAGPHGLAWFLATLFAAYAIVTAWRGFTRRSAPAA